MISNKSSTSVRLESEFNRGSTAVIFSNVEAVLHGLALELISFKLSFSPRFDFSHKLNLPYLSKMNLKTRWKKSKFLVLEPRLKLAFLKNLKVRPFFSSTNLNTSTTITAITTTLRFDTDHYCPQSGTVTRIITGPHDLMPRSPTCNIVVIQLLWNTTC